MGNFSHPVCARVNIQQDAACLWGLLSTVFLKDERISWYLPNDRQQLLRLKHVTVINTVYFDIRLYEKQLRGAEF